MPNIDRVKIGETIYFVRDNQLASAIIANEYNPSTEYYVGEYCTYENLVYKCIYEISSPEEWNSNHWSNIRVLNEITDKADRTDTVLNSTLSRGRAISTVVGTGSIAFGFNVEGSGDFSEAKGNGTIASGECATARGTGTKALENNSNVFGKYNVPDVVDYQEWEANTSYAVGDHVKITGDPDITYYVCVVANDDAEFDANNWEEVAKPEGHLEIVGNGIADNNRSNARALDFDGNEFLKGALQMYCNDDSSGGVPVAESISFTSTDTTKALVFEKLSKIQDGKVAPLFMSGEAMTVMSGYTSVPSFNSGFVMRIGAGSYNFILRNESNGLKSCNLTGATGANTTWTWTEFDFAKKLSLYSSDSTWEAIWAKLSLLSNNDTVTFYAMSSAFKILSSNARNQVVVGTVTRLNTNSNFVFNLTAGAGTSRIPITAYLENASSSSPGSYYEVDTEAEIAQRARQFYFLSGADSTWDKIWEKINTLGTGEPAVFIADGNAYKALSGNVRVTKMYGYIGRRGADKFYIFGMMHDLTFITASIEGASASSGGTYAEYDIVSDINDCHTDISNRIVGTKQYKSIPGNTNTCRIDFENSICCFCIFSMPGNRTWIGYIYTDGNGTCSPVQINSATNMTVTGNTNYITCSFTYSSMGNFFMTAIPYRGSGVPTFH